MRIASAVLLMVVAAFWEPAIAQSVSGDETLCREGLRGHWEAVVAACTRALKNNVSDATRAHLLVDRGLMYGTARDYDHAFADLNMAIRLQPDSADAIALRGMLYEEIRDDRHALADFNEAIRLEPHDYLMFLHRGAALAGTGDFDAAIKDLDHAIALGPDRWDAYAARADFRARMGDAAGSKADCLRARELDAPSGWDGTIFSPVSDFQCRRE